MTVTLEANPTHAPRGEAAKQRIKRLSKVIKARQNKAGGDEVQHTKSLFRKFVDVDDDAYFENVKTGEVVWDLPEDGTLAELYDDVQHTKTLF